MARRRERSFDDDSGLAIVVALLVTMISFIVATAVLAQALHNVTQAGYMRRRLSAVNAAEAGLNLYWKMLEKTTIQSLTSSAWTKTGSVYEYTGTDVASRPDGALFRLRVRYVKENPCVDRSTGNPRTCSEAGLTEQSLTEDPFPPTVYAIVRSIGCVGRADQCWSASSPGVRRALETVMRLRTTYGGISGAVSASYLCLDQDGKLDITGDFYVMGAAGDGPPGWPDYCKSGVVVGDGDSLDLHGNLYAADGNLEALDNGGHLWVYGDVWAKDAVQFGENGPAGVAKCIDDLSLKVCVTGSATGTAVNLGPKALVEGDIVICSPACPPTVLDFPKLVWDPNDWATWAIHEVPDAATAVAAMATSNERAVYHVTGSNCSVPVSGTYVVTSDFAIVGECKFEITGADFSGSTGTILLMSLWPGTPSSPGDLPPKPGCGGGGFSSGSFGFGPRDIYMHNRNELGYAKFFFYTPCTLKFDNNQSTSSDTDRAVIKGQLLVRFLWVKNKLNVENVPVFDGGTSLPGVVSGFSQDVRYINEITIAAALV